MKKAFKLFASLGAFTLMLGASIGVGLKESEQKAEVAEADSTYTVYFTRPGWNDCKDSIPNVYTSGTWPGSAMTWAYDNESSEAVFKAEIPTTSTLLIFNFMAGGSLKQTTDIKSSTNPSLPTNNKTGYYFGSWIDEGYVTFNPGTWQLKFFTVNYDSNGGTGSMNSKQCYCSATAGNNLDSNSFTRQGYTFSGWNTRADGKGTSYANEAHIRNDTEDATVTLYAQWTRASGRYIVGNFGDCSWGIEGAIYMNEVNSQYEAQIELEFGDTFKIAYYNGSSLQDDSYFGYSWIRSGCGAYQYFSGDGDSDIECYARGTYNFYFRDIEYESGKKISIELDSSLNAEHLAAQLMSFGVNPSSGHCGDNNRFPAMKAIYLGLSDDEKSEFQGYENSLEDQFHNAYLRYTHWATALHKDPWVADPVNERISLSSSSESSSITIILTTLTGILTIGGFFYYRKKRS